MVLGTGARRGPSASPRRLAQETRRGHHSSGKPENLRAEAGRLREIYNDAWKENWGFVPFTEKEFEFMAKELKQLVVPEFTLIAEVGDEPVGFILCVPDINVALQQDQRSPNELRTSDRPGKASLPQEPDPHGAP